MVKKTLVCLLMCVPTSIANASDKEQLRLSGVVQEKMDYSFHYDSGQKEWSLKSVTNGSLQAQLLKRNHIYIVSVSAP